MAHFAQLDENNVVTNVIVIGNDDMLDENGNESEAVGIAFCKNLLGDNTNWVQTSYNNNIRGKFAKIGYVYNRERDVFLSPKPSDDFMFDEEKGDWVPDPSKHHPELMKFAIPITLSELS